MLIASVRFFEKKNNPFGRLNPPQTGYRPTIELSGMCTSCLIESTDGEVNFSFDRDHRVSLKLISVDKNFEIFKVGQAIKFYEGNNLVGMSTVLEVD